jgi:tetratricopeptide (TPR) repeat protein
MSSGRHYDDATLLALVDPALGPVDAAVAEHVAECSFCEREVLWLRTFTESMKDPEVWERPEAAYLPPPERMRIVFDFAARLDLEDREAAERLPRLLEGPREWWHTKLVQHPEYRTAGMVRKLIEATDRAIETVPADALEITNLAVEIADHLELATYPSDTVIKLRGGAWREKAFALYYVGELNPSLIAIDMAEAISMGAPLLEFDLARIWLVRAIILRSFERSSESVLLARKSLAVFEKYGDAKRAMDARSIEAMALYKLGRVLEALTTWKALEVNITNDPQRAAGTLLNIAICYSDLQQNGLAAEFAHQAIQLFDEIDVPTGKVRARWLLGRMLAARGEFESARLMFTQVRREFERLKMFAESNEVALETAEILLVLRQPLEVDEICHTLLERYAEAGLAHTYRAIMALNYLKEAASMGRLTPALVRHVRQYISRLPAEPNLLFAPPQAS